MLFDFDDDNRSLSIKKSASKNIKFEKQFDNNSQERQMIDSRQKETIDQSEQKGIQVKCLPCEQYPIFNNNH